MWSVTSKLFPARWYLEEQQQQIIIKITIILSLQFRFDSFSTAGSVFKLSQAFTSEISWCLVSLNKDWAKKLTIFLVLFFWWTFVYLPVWLLGMFIAEINLTISTKQANSNNNKWKLLNHIQTSKWHPITCLYSLALLLFNG